MINFRVPKKVERKPFLQLETTKNLATPKPVKKRKIEKQIFYFFKVKKMSPVRRKVPKTLGSSLCSQTLWFLAMSIKTN